MNAAATAHLLVPLSIAMVDAFTVSGVIMFVAMQATSPLATEALLLVCLDSLIFATSTLIYITQLAAILSCCGWQN